MGCDKLNNVESDVQHEKKWCLTRKKVMSVYKLNIFESDIKRS